jgi:predicted nucleotidyltransferase
MTALPVALSDVIERLASGLKALYRERYRGLVLYGSYARGTADEASDVDLLLLLEGPVNPEREILRLEPVKWPLSLASGFVLSVLPVSLSAYEQGERLFLRHARREGIVAA